jgi:pimeloyl-ACP methyl ester carboxylesterase
MRRACVIALLAAAALGPVSGSAWQPPRHIVYLHGRIVQERQDPRPWHEEFGYYELEQILGAFRARGFAVSGGIRPRDASVGGSADETVGEVRRLIEGGVPAGRITVVGASMGGGIALLAAARLQNADVRVAVLGTCLSSSVRALEASEGKRPAGRVLSIREASDSVTEPCEPWFSGSAGRAPLAVRELVLATGLKHGFLYRPLPEWVGPVVEWAWQPEP